MKLFNFSSLVAVLGFGLSGALSAQSALPDPDGKEADLSKPVQVYILMG